MFPRRDSNSHGITTGGFWVRCVYHKNNTIYPNPTLQLYNTFFIKLNYFGMPFGLPSHAMEIGNVCYIYASIIFKSLTKLPILKKIRRFYLLGLSVFTTAANGNICWRHRFSVTKPTHLYLPTVFYALDQKFCNFGFCIQIHNWNVLSHFNGICAQFYFFECFTPIQNTILKTRYIIPLSTGNLHLSKCIWR